MKFRIYSDLDTGVDVDKDEIGDENDDAADAAEDDDATDAAEEEDIENIERCRGCSENHIKFKIYSDLATDVDVDVDDNIAMH